MPTWIFQTIDADRIAAIAAGRTDRWCVRRYRGEMQAGDQIFVWLGGPATVRGIHGSGQLVAVPYCEHEATFVDVQYDQRILSFVPAAALRSHPTLQDLFILHMPRATNFRVTPVQAAALVDLLGLVPAS